ncbi:MAG TPA: YIP1 family protein [Acidisarcina sp.]
MSEIDAGTPTDVALATEPLSQGQRVIYTFTAPSRTFTDIIRDRSWWLPFLLTLIVSYVFIFAMVQKVGWEKLTASGMKQNAAQAERVNNMPADQKAVAMRQAMMFTKGITLGYPVVALLMVAIISLGLWGTINFIFGGKATYGEIFAVWMYASLPLMVKGLLGAASLFAGLDSEAFNIQNPVGTNIGYYLPPDSAKWLLSLGSWFDVITIWHLVLGSIGIAIVARVKRSSGYMAVFGWWLLIMVISVGIAAATS